ncbi:PF11026 family protein [Leptospira sp. B5-022]|nr:PF11026 family protein [Leptospira sp. B5-022]
MTGTEILAGMIAPAVLISATASLIFSTANRLGRIFDRVNLLKNEIEGVVEGKLSFPEERLAYLRRQLKVQKKRANLIQRSMAALYTATLFFVSSSLSLGIIVAISSSASWVATGLALIGGIFLFIASSLLLYESRYNLNFIQGQIEFAEFLEDKVEKKSDTSISK